MLKRIGPLPRFVLGMAGIFVLLAITAVLWWRLPPWSRAVWSGALDWDFMARSPHNIFISRNGRTLAAQDFSTNRLHLWDVATGQKSGSYPLSSYSSVSANWFMPDGRSLVYSHFPNGGQEFLFNVASIEAVSHEHHVLIARHVGLGVTAWDLTRGEPRAPWNPHWIEAIVQRPDGPIVGLEVHNLNSLAVWDLIGGKKTASFTDVALDRLLNDGRHIAVVSAKELLICDTLTGRRRCAFPIQGKRAACVRWDESAGRAYLIGDDDRNDWAMTVWDITAEEPRKLTTIDYDGLGYFSPDGRWLAFAVGRLDRRVPGLPFDGTITVLDLATLQEKHQITDFLVGHPPGSNSDIPTNQFAPDSQTFAALVHHRPSWLDRYIYRNPDRPGVRIWETSTGRVLGTLWDCEGFTYYPDGKSMATWSRDGTIRIYDLPPWRPWWIDYGLPVVFALLVLLSLRLLWRAFRKPAEVSPC